jgi:C-terminal processing protease CtpA/Prc
LPDLSFDSHPADSIADVVVVKKSGAELRASIPRGAGIGGGGVRPETSLDSVASADSLDSLASGNEQLRGLGITFYRSGTDGSAPNQPGAVVKRVKEGGAAERARPPVVPGDRLLAVDGAIVRAGLSGTALARLVMGPPGSVAVVRLRRNGADFETRIIRDSVSDGGVRPEPSISFDSTGSGSSGWDWRSRCGVGLTFLPPDVPGGHYRIKRVKEGGAAAAAAARGALGPGDELLAVDGVAATGLDSEGLARLLQGQTGTRCRLRLRRGTTGAEVDVEVVRGPVPSEPTPVPAADTSSGGSGGAGRAGLGMVFWPAGAGGGGAAGLSGLVVKRVTEGGAAERGGVEPGDRLLSIDGKDVATLDGQCVQTLIRSNSFLPLPLEQPMLHSNYPYHARESTDKAASKP